MKVELTTIYRKGDIHICTEFARFDDKIYRINDILCVGVARVRKTSEFCIFTTIFLMILLLDFLISVAGLQNLIYIKLSCLLIAAAVPVFIFKKVGDVTYHLVLSQYSGPVSVVQSADLGWVKGLQHAVETAMRRSDYH